MTAGLAVFEINVAKQIVLCIQNFSSKDHTEPLHRFDTNLIVVGGTGIAAALPYILAHLEADRKSERKTLKIHLVWSIRQRQMFYRIFTNELAAILQHQDITTSVYCTKLDITPREFDSDDCVLSKNCAPEVMSTRVGSPASNGSLRFMPGRPNIHELIMSEMGEARNSSSSIGVLTCGPAQMADQYRDAVYEAMKHGFHEIDYYEEAFGW
ncbi:FAD-binding 8 [Penicillium daleae]|uniref:FAD-binding 8 n=1 Tax=Penicillium daleae TaxID=63821 RepID=A0AAD6G294_9EURO|nr:FAD-binding 8 [Penicillium daleae]KAJ5444686.1 FAD-binding 8 [Penicillium daleae]